MDPTAQWGQALHHDTAAGVRCLVTTAHTLWCLGYQAQARRRGQEALSLAQAVAHPHTLAFAHQWAAVLHHHYREVLGVQAEAEALLALASAQGFALYAALGTFFRGWALTMQGHGNAALVQMQQSLAAVLATGTILPRPYCLVMLADASAHLGEVAEALRLLAEARTELEATGRQATNSRRPINSRAHSCCAKRTLSARNPASTRPSPWRAASRRDPASCALP